MTVLDYQAQTAANLEKLQAIKLDLSVLESLEESAEIEDEVTPPTPSLSAAKPPRVMLAFLMGLSVGVSLGAAGVAIAISLF